jgi:hypothetical protein
MEASAVAAETSLSPILEMTSHEREARASLLESIDARAGVLLASRRRSPLWHQEM